jgi:hypothetical protein
MTPAFRLCDDYVRQWATLDSVMVPSRASGSACSRPRTRVAIDNGLRLDLPLPDVSMRRES